MAKLKIFPINAHMSQIKKIVDPMIHARCIDRGYSRKRGYYLKPIKGRDKWLQGLLISCSTFSTERSFYFTVGLCHEDIIKVSDLVSDRKWIPLLLNTNIGYIMPIHSWREWSFYEGQTAADYEVTCDKMFEDLDRYGDAFFEANASIKNMLNYYENTTDFGFTGSVLPMLYVLTGQKDKIPVYLNRLIDEGKKRKEDMLQLIDKYQKIDFPKDRSIYFSEEIEA